MTQTQGTSVSLPFAATPTQPTPATLQAEVEGLLKRVQGCVAAGMTDADPFRTNLERQLEDARARLVLSRPPSFVYLMQSRLIPRRKRSTTAS